MAITSLVATTISTYNSYYQSTGNSHSVIIIFENKLMTYATNLDTSQPALPELHCSLRISPFLQGTICIWLGGAIQISRLVISICDPEWKDFDGCDNHQNLFHSDQNLSIQGNKLEWPPLVFELLDKAKYILVCHPFSGWWDKYESPRIWCLLKWPSKTLRLG